MAPGACQMKISCHAEEEEGQGENHTDEKFTGLVLDFCITSSLLGIFLLGVFHWNDAIPGLAYRSIDIPGRGDSRDICY